MACIRITKFVGKGGKLEQNNKELSKCIRNNKMKKNKLKLLLSIEILKSIIKP